MITKEKALEILDKLEFFGGQRAGRELWFEKNRQIQDKDIASFVRDISDLREYISGDCAARNPEIQKNKGEKQWMNPR